MLLIILLVLFFLAASGGSWGYSRWGATSLSPMGVIALLLIVLFFTGNLRC
jgi:hypothetical protein